LTPLDKIFTIEQILQTLPCNNFTQGFQRIAEPPITLEFGWFLLQKIFYCAA